MAAGTYPLTQRGCDQAASINQCQQSAHHRGTASVAAFNVFIMACIAAGGGAEGVSY